MKFFLAPPNQNDGSQEKRHADQAEGMVAAFAVDEAISEQG